MPNNILTAIACIVIFASPGFAKTLNYRYVDQWMISAHSHDETGQFSHCGTSVSYRSGITLYFAIGRDFRWVMGFSNKAWKLTPGEEYPVMYQIDQGTPVSAKARVSNENFVAVRLLDSDALFAAFRQGHLLTVYAAGQTFEFALTNSSKALAATLACASTNVVAAPANPFLSSTPASPPATGTAPDVGYKAEAAALTANLLSNAGVKDFQLIDDIPEDLDFFHAMWVAPGLVGGLTINSSSTVDKSVSAVTAAATSGCKGRFATAKLPVSTAGASIKTVCETATGPDVTSYVFLTRQRGGVYVLMTMEAGEDGDREGGANAEVTGGRLMDASIKVLEAR